MADTSENVYMSLNVKILHFMQCTFHLNSELLLHKSMLSAQLMSHEPYCIMHCELSGCRSAEYLQCLICKLLCSLQGLVCNLIHTSPQLCQYLLCKPQDLQIAHVLSLCSSSCVITVLQLVCYHCALTSVLSLCSSWCVVPVLQLACYHCARTGVLKLCSSWCVITVLQLVCYLSLCSSWCVIAVL